MVWHAGFLAFAQSFIDVDTVIPAMMVESGGSALQIGLLTAIMLGGSSFTQLFFAPFVSNFSFKKKFLLLGINARILALLAMGFMLYYNTYIGNDYRILFIFFLISIFSLGGAFANVSYTDILGKSILQEKRKSFFSIRQIIGGVIITGSVFVARKVLVSSAYPQNYAHMFFIGFIALSVASLGFWKVKETIPSKLSVRSPGHFLKIMRSELKENPKLGNYLGFINTMGISIGLLPFVILYAKENFSSVSTDTANFLVFKVIGNVAMGVVLFLLAKQFRYRNLLYFNALIAMILPAIIMFSGSETILNFVFFIGGIIFAIYTITMNGVLLEVSGTSNRTLYTGISGAGNIIPALFPLLGGWVIEQLGFNVFFILYSITIAASFVFIYRLKCKL